MKTREELSDVIEKYIGTLDLPQNPEGLYEPIKYALEGGGKRIRPVVMLMACEAFSGKPADVMPVAAAVEVYHNFTLLHDDLMDNAEVRRSKPSVHKKWDNNTAILSGDAMLIYSYNLLQKAAPEFLPAVMAEFVKMTMEVCEGQQYDMEFEKREDVTIEQYLDMIRLKTAVLFAGSAKIGGMIAGASAEDCEKLYTFGLNLGLAFQLQDDYLDTYGTAEVLGKAIGGDIAEGKKTFLAITALNEAGEATKRAMLATFRDHTASLSNKISRIKTIYNSLSIPEITKEAIDGLLSKASEALRGLSIPAENTEPMQELLRGLARRNK